MNGFLTVEAIPLATILGLSARRQDQRPMPRVSHRPGQVAA
jgi:hypothetical protein